MLAHSHQPIEFFDRWIPRLGSAALVALAIGLVGLGIALYAPVENTHRHSTLPTGISGRLGRR